MKIIGVTGGIGAGKSTVIELVRKNFPVAVIYTDDVAREQMKQGGCSYQEVIKVFGTSILMDDGEINRSKLAEVIFSSEENVRIINSITHPNVKKFTLQQIEEYRQTGNYVAVLVETALLFTAKFDEFCDETWCIDANENVRKQRLMKNRNYSEEKVNAIFGQQVDDHYAKQHCTYVIENNDDTAPDEILQKVKKILEYCK